MTEERSDRHSCGALAWWRANHVELSRRCHPETNPYRDPLPEVLICQLPPHNRDQRHSMTLRLIPRAYGGGWLVALWGKDCERDMLLSFVHFPLSLDRKTLAETSGFH